MAMGVTLRARRTPNSLEAGQTSDGTATDKQINQSGCRCTAKRTAICQKKSTQSGQTTCRHSEASARQQRPPVLLEFGSQTKHSMTLIN
ncbi:hypothetical protein EYF80_006162 [Liparis tanakae]|uniref:Uncharacterized protein n=1 Tax=Liparis tanakae TaxID=230148 RepID=A0A4Z2J1G1_9TELE|nr:hypothetical protein EYF80_006162 [Liparis tanakae]